MALGSRKIGRSVLALLTVLAAGWLVASWLGSSGGARNGQRLNIDVAATKLDFGEQPPVERFQWTLPITNTTRQPLHVLEFEKSCECSDVVPRQLTLEPGEKRHVHLTLDLRPRDEDSLGAAARDFAVTIKPIIKGLPAQAPWQVTGQVVNPYLADPPYVDFRDSLVAGTPFRDTEVRVSGTQRLEHLNATCDAAMGEVTVESIANSDDFILRVKPNSSLPVGRHEFAIGLQGKTKDGLNLPSCQLRVFLEIVHDIAVSPPLAHFGALKVGATGTRDLVLVSRTESQFDFLGCELGNAKVQFEIAEVRGTTQVLRLSRLAELPGSQVERIAVRVRSELDGEVRGASAGSLLLRSRGEQRWLTEKHEGRRSDPVDDICIGHCRPC